MASFCQTFPFIPPLKCIIPPLTQKAWHIWDGFQQRDKPILLKPTVGPSQDSFNERENHIKPTYPCHLYEGHNMLPKLLLGTCITHF